MVNRAFFVALAVLRIAVGASLLYSGLQKLDWFVSSPLRETFAQWAEHPANGFVAGYLAFLTAHHALFARLVALGELGLGALLLLGLLTPLAALLAFLLVFNINLASSAIFSLDYLKPESGLSYLLIFPVLFFGRAGTAFGLDGAIARRGRKSPS
jgi:uncharacterized membrane protein YphA (DoxX/SURF4 family)